MTNMEITTQAGTEIIERDLRRQLLVIAMPAIMQYAKIRKSLELHGITPDDLEELMRVFDGKVQCVFSDVKVYIDVKYAVNRNTDLIMEDPDYSKMTGKERANVRSDIVKKLAKEAQDRGGVSANM